jgi:hypothetical protein
MTASGAHFNQQARSGDDDGGDIFQNQQQSGAGHDGGHFGGEDDGGDIFDS